MPLGSFVDLHDVDGPEAGFPGQYLHVSSAVMFDSMVTAGFKRKSFHAHQVWS
jgi:hypothetical protein